VGSLQHDLRAAGVQAPLCCPRSRTCLLKGCGRRFRPCCGRRHFCSEPCRDAARRWSVHKAQQRYRSSVRGRKCRREQSRRWRARCRQRGQAVRKSSGGQPGRACEGHQQEAGEKISCDRPGCYSHFRRSARCPGQRFCSPLCREALRSAFARQRRWREGCGPCPWAYLADDLPEGRGTASYVLDIEAMEEQRILKGDLGAREEGSTGSREGRGRGILF
jgi:hypothetical protein